MGRGKIGVQTTMYEINYKDILHISNNYKWGII